MLKDSLIQDVDLFLMKPLLISKYQGVIRKNLAEAMEGQKGGPNAMRNLIAAVHHGDIQAWLGVAGPEGDRKMIGMLFTRVTPDRLMETKTLLIYGFNLKAQLHPDAYEKGFQTLADYARQHGCYALVAQTKVGGLRKLLDRYGWSNGMTTHTKEL